MPLVWIMHAAVSQLSCAGSKRSLSSTPSSGHSGETEPPAREAKGKPESPDSTGREVASPSPRHSLTGKRQPSAAELIAFLPLDYEQVLWQPLAVCSLSVAVMQLASWAPCGQRVQPRTPALAQPSVLTALECCRLAVVHVQLRLLHARVGPAVPGRQPGRDRAGCVPAPHHLLGAVPRRAPAAQRQARAHGGLPAALRQVRQVRFAVQRFCCRNACEASCKAGASQYTSCCRPCCTAWCLQEALRHSLEPPTSSGSPHPPPAAGTRS